MQDGGGRDSFRKLIKGVLTNLHGVLGKSPFDPEKLSMLKCPQ